MQDERGDGTKSLGRGPSLVEVRINIEVCNDDPFLCKKIIQKYSKSEPKDIKDYCQWLTMCWDDKC